MSLSLCSKLTRILRDMGRSLKHKEPDSEPAMVQSGSLGLGGSGGDGGVGEAAWSSARLSWDMPDAARAGFRLLAPVPDRPQSPSLFLSCRTLYRVVWSR
jgi:hypothetical protein